MADRTTSDIRVLASELVKRMNEDTRRIRLLEQKLDRVESLLSSMEDNITEDITKLSTSINKISENVKLFTDKIKTTDSFIVKINKDLAKKATKGDFSEFEHYMDLMNPITSSFITKGELERILEEKIGKKT